MARCYRLTVGGLHPSRRFGSGRSHLPVSRQPWSSRWETKTKTTSAEHRAATVSKAIRPKVTAPRAVAMSAPKVSRGNLIRAATRPVARNVSSRASRNAAVNRATKECRTTGMVATANQKTVQRLAGHPVRRAQDPATKTRKTANPGKNFASSRATRSEPPSPVRVRKGTSRDAQRVLDDAHEPVRRGQPEVSAADR
jgi:hypothetical protein